MSRSLSTGALRSVLAQQTDQVWLVLLEIVHPDLPATLYFTSDNKGTVRGSNTYIPFPFDVALPADLEGQVPRVKLTIDNVDRRIVDVLRTLDSSPTVRLLVVLADTPAVVEAGPFEFTLLDATYDVSTVSGELGFEPILSEPFPSDAYTPANFPGLF